MTVLDTVWMITTPDRSGFLNRGIVYSRPAKSAGEAWSNCMDLFREDTMMSMEEMKRRGWRAKRVVVSLRV